MLENLSSKFEDAIKTLKGENKITDKNIEPALRLVRRALLEADVNLEIVNEFLKDLKEEAIGAEVIRGIRPEQKFVDIVHRRLVEIMGENNEPLIENSERATIIMLVGLQGAGKTTAAAKLGLSLKKEGNKVLLVAADTFRPAAKDQLQKLGEDIGVTVYVGDPFDDSIGIAREGVKLGMQQGFNRIIVDTAGRLYIDEESMLEVSIVKEVIKPDEILLVVDSMIGQEAADLTKTFDNRIGITGTILTKMDGDSRGGAALSIKKISGKSIKFIGTGEKVEALEAFYPERIASRILGMGDILTLVDKAQKEIEIGDVLSMQKKFQEATFNFKDFVQQMKLIKRMGSLSGLLRLIPGMNKIDEAALKSGETQLKRIESIINSMTNLEREQPELLIKSQKRRKRVATGSGHTSSEIDKVISDFERMRSMMQDLSTGKLGKYQDKLGNARENISASSGTRSEHANRRSSAKKNMKRRKGFFEL